MVPAICSERCPRAGPVRVATCVHIEAGSDTARGGSPDNPDGLGSMTFWGFFGDGCYVSSSQGVCL